MERINRMRDADGVDYEVPDSEMDEFRSSVPTAKPVMRFRDGAGGMYDVPEADVVQFKGMVKDAEPIFRFGNGADGKLPAFDISESQGKMFRDAMFATDGSGQDSLGEEGYDYDANRRATADGLVKAWRDAGLPDLSADEIVYNGNQLSSALFAAGVRGDAEARRDDEQKRRDEITRAVEEHWRRLGPNIKNPLDSEGAGRPAYRDNPYMKKIITYSPDEPGLSDQGVAPSSPLDPRVQPTDKIGSLERLYLQDVASKGADEGVMEFLLRRVPGIGTTMKTLDIQKRRALEGLANGSFNDSVQMGNAAHTIGIPDETIRRIQEAAYTGEKTQAGIPIVDQEKARTLWQDELARLGLLEKREDIAEKAERTLGEDVETGAEKIVGGMISLPSDVIELTPLGFAATGMSKILNKADELERKGDSGDAALSKATIGTVAEALIWNKLNKAAKFIPGATNVGKNVKRVIEIANGSAKTEADKASVLAARVVGGNAAQLLDMSAKSHLTELVNDVAGMDRADREQREKFGEWLKKFISVPGNAEKMLELLPAHLIMKGVHAAKGRKDGENGTEPKLSRRTSVGELAKRKFIADRIGAEKTKALTPEDVEFLDLLLHSPGLTEDAVGKFISSVDGDMARLPLKDALEKAKELFGKKISVGTGDVKPGAEVETPAPESARQQNEVARAKKRQLKQEEQQAREKANEQAQNLWDEGQREQEQLEAAGNVRTFPAQEQAGRPSEGDAATGETASSVAEAFQAWCDEVGKPKKRKNWRRFVQVVGIDAERFDLDEGGNVVDRLYPETPQARLGAAEEAKTASGGTSEQIQNEPVRQIAQTPAEQNPAQQESVQAAQPSVQESSAEPQVKERSNRLRRNVKEVNFRHQGESQQQPKEVTNETGNVPVEAQPEPSVQDAGRGGQQQAPQAAEGSVEVEAPRGEVPAAREVGAKSESASAAQPATQPAARPMPAATQEQKPVEQEPVSKSDRGGQKLTGGEKEEATPSKAEVTPPATQAEPPAAEPSKTAPASAPRAEGTTTPPQSAEPVQGAESAAGGATGGASEEPKPTQGNKLRGGGEKKGQKLRTQAEANAATQAAQETPATQEAEPEASTTPVKPEAAPEATATAEATTTPATPEVPAAKDNKLKPATGAKRGRKAKPDAELEAAPAPTADEQAQPASQFRDKNGNMKKTLRGAVERIASAIGNRTGKGAITPEEADGIVNGIAESPEVKHNRSARFFTPLVTDAEWQDSLGVDAESAKNIRDAVVRAKTDSEMAHFFVQVDKAVKKAKDGKLSPKDAVPLSGKISEGLEKAEREGRHEAARRLREAMEVIKPVVDAVSQEDVDKFNRSAKGKKLHTQLDGSDRRSGSRGKTVSLDTKDGTVDVGTDGRTLDDVADEISDSSHDRRTLKPGESYGKGFTAKSDNDTTGTEGTRQGSTGKGGDLAGKRAFQIVERNGDDITVAMRVPKKGVIRQTVKLSQLRELAESDPDIKQALDSLEKGEEIRASKPAPEAPASRDARFAADADYQRWLKARKANDAEPLRQRYEMEQAKAVGDSFKNAVGGVDVEYVGDRDYDPARDNPNGGRELKDRDTGTVLGIFNRDTGKLKLFRGANWKTLNHELGGHATMRYAEQEAERGNRALLDKINEAVDGAPQWLKDEVKSRYPDADEATLRDEIWAALRERPSEAMQKYVKTLQGRKWYNRAWDAIKTAWRGILSRMGFNRADLSGVDKMTPDEFNEFLDKATIGGKTLGRIETQGGESSVRMARGPAAPGANIMDDVVTRGEKVRERLDDARIILRKELDRTGATREVIDPKTGFLDWRQHKNPVTGKTDWDKTTVNVDQMMDKLNGYVQKHNHVLQIRYDKISRIMADNGISDDLVDKYLLALHAEERNRTIATRRGDAWTPTYADGAGVSTEWANKFLASQEVRKNLSALTSIEKIVHDVVQDDLRQRLESGRLSQDQYNFYANRWKRYVPLKTDVMAGSSLEERFNSSTAGMKRNEFITSKGRGADNIADSPLTFAFVQAGHGIQGAAKNMTGNVAANWVDFLESKGLNSVQITDPKTKSTRTEYRVAEIVPAEVVKHGGTEFAATFADGTKARIGGDMQLASNQSNLVLFKRPERVELLDKKGKPTGKFEEQSRLYVIRFNPGANGRGLAIAKEINETNMAKVPDWLKYTYIPKITGYLSRMNTSASPSFLLSNVLNDRNEAWRALVARYGILDGTKIAEKMLTATYTDRKYVKDWIVDGKLTPGTRFKEFIDAGGQIKGGVSAHGYAEESKILQDNLARYKREAISFKQSLLGTWKPEMTMRLFSSIGRFNSTMNEIAELNTRAAIFSALRDSGVSVVDAVRFAREGTTNFNRRGTFAPVIGSFYMYYNANVQGLKRNFQSLRDNHGLQMAATWALAATLSAMYKHYVGGKDDDENGKNDGGRNARNAPEYYKQTSIGIPLGNKAELQILKMRGFDAIIPYMATKITEASLGDTSWGDATKEIAKALEGEAAGIVGGQRFTGSDWHNLTQTLLPSALDTMGQLATGKNWRGERRRKMSFDDNAPLAYNGKDSTSPIVKKVAQVLNDVTGGDKFKPGLVNLAPEDISLLVETFAGGLGRDIMGAINTAGNAKKLLGGDVSESTLSQMPVVKSVAKEYPDSSSKYFDAIEEYRSAKKRYKKLGAGADRKAMKEKMPYLSVQRTRLDELVDYIDRLRHRENGMKKNDRGEWVPRNVPLTDDKVKQAHEKLLRLQAEVLRILGK